VTPRRWLLLANPALAQTITAASGDSWITDLSQLRRLKPLAGDPAFHHAFRRAKRTAKWQFADWLR
jgi:starch phosphorylase